MQRTRSAAFVLSSLVILALAVPGSASAQGLPFAGNIVLSLTPSTATPSVGADFTVDVTMDASGVTGVCSSTGGIVPFTFGGYVITFPYDDAKLEFRSAALCPTVTPELTFGFLCGLTYGRPGEVVCQAFNTGNTDRPQGSVCALRLTFTNLAATSGSPASITTRHAPPPRGISANVIVTPVDCGHLSYRFPVASIVDTTLAVGASPVTVKLAPQTIFGNTGIPSWQVGTPNTAKATVLSGGVAVPGRTVTFRITSGPNAGRTAQATTNASGVATFTYASTRAGTDTLIASVDDYAVVCASNAASIRWVTVKVGSSGD